MSHSRQWVKVQPHKCSVVSSYPVLRSLYAALITDLAYGIKIKEHNDPYVKQVEEALGAISEATIPGKYFVEMFPIMKHIPSWFPGAGWKRRAQYYKKINELVACEPFEIVKNNLVFDIMI